MGDDTHRMLFRRASVQALQFAALRRDISPISDAEKTTGFLSSRTRYNGEVPILTLDRSTAPVPIRQRNGLHRWVSVPRALLYFALALTFLFFALRYVHLRADFPNGSRWTDWAKYTDEGWYGDGAIRHYLLGTWRLPGDFNPAAALPVWPLLEAIIFRFTGVGIVAARALVVTVFGATLLCGFLLVQRNRPATLTTKLCAAGAVLIMAGSPYFYVFSRMAVVEPLLALLTAFTLLVAWKAGHLPKGRQQTLLLVGIGVLVALMAGTKTTAISLVPAIAYLLASSFRWRRADLLRSALISGGTALFLGSLYYFAVVRPHYLEDFRYLFEANHNTIRDADPVTILKMVATDGVWIGEMLYRCFLAAVLFSVLRPRIWRDSIFTSLMLWVAGYLAFIIYHANLQPRYYFVIAVPMVLATFRAVQHLVDWQPRTAPAILLFFAGLFSFTARYTLHFVQHPEYSFQNAARQVDRIVRSDPRQSHMILSISGSDLTLMTGLPSICDDFGTMELEDRIATYRPGWFVTWNYVEDDKMDALAKFYRLTRVADIPAMDDPDRNLMIVYRLDPKQGVEPKRRGHSSRHT